MKKKPDLSIPECPECHTPFENSWDDISEQISEYLWAPRCKHYPMGVIVSIG